MLIIDIDYHAHLPSLGEGSTSRVSNSMSACNWRVKRERERRFRMFQVGEFFANR